MSVTTIKIGTADHEADGDQFLAGATPYAFKNRLRLIDPDNFLYLDLVS